MTKRTALEIADTIINDMHRFPERKEAAEMLRSQHAEIERLTADIARLQRIIDSRPAVNLALVENYIRWSSGIYESEIARAVGLDS